MSFLGFLLLGLIAGAIAKAILPGRQGGGWFITLLLGVIGAFLGGWLGGLLFNVRLGEFFSLTTWVLAIVGSLIVLLIYGGNHESPPRQVVIRPPDRFNRFLSVALNWVPRFWCCRSVEAPTPKRGD
ncbi:GlsB/YeaQ/YmgE family stress response membrane protein [Cryobacterium serini]|uniref:GlsB/YeaQ/YmgE family stress response membrane protein n=1 Tax=Cryobacterium serini TaxID=1259201 RepID=A0A4R9BSS3_9MICO|nr:GlsB/YeaQ/YmgE family stress response membrane protein [Cryobacterium serini]